MPLKMLVLTLLIALFSIACGTDPEESTNQAHDSNEIETCDGMPTCMPGDREVQSCPDDASCYPETLCGATILCEAVTCDLPDACPEDYEEVDTCDDANCLEVTTCDQEVLICQPLIHSCGAAPTCPPGTTEVDQCDEPEACQEITECNSTILCQDDASCVETPVCPFGYDPVDTCSDTDACLEVEGCEETLRCEESVFCDAIPVCHDEDPEVQTCPTGATCYDLTECATTITCMSQGPLLCEEYGCPEGYSAATSCANPPDEGVLAEGCDAAILCGGALAPSPCDVEATCPDGWAPFTNCEDTLEVCALVSICTDLIECAPQPLVDDYNALCDTSCPDGFSSVDDLATCVVGTGSGDDNDTIDGSLCLYGDACGTEFFCRADEPLDCSSAYDLCGPTYEAVSECSPGDICVLGMACNADSLCKAL